MGDTAGCNPGKMPGRWGVNIPGRPDAVVVVECTGNLPDMGVLPGGSVTPGISGVVPGGRCGGMIGGGRLETGRL